MKKYLLFSYIPRFGGKGGMNDLVLQFDSPREIELKEINPPLDRMYGYVYQLLNTESGELEEFVSQPCHNREDKDIREVLDERVKELSRWLVDTLIRDK